MKARKFSTAKNKKTSRLFLERMSKDIEDREAFDI